MSKNETSTVRIVDIDLEEIIMFSNATRPSSSPIISDELLQMLILVSSGIIGQIVTIFGMGSNTINLIVFYQMGFKASINVGLFGLAISDFFSCLTAAWQNLCLTPAFQELDLPFNSVEIQHVTGGWPHIMLVKISGCVTAYIAFERCLCITFPLKVKNILTPKRCVIFIVCIWIVNLGLFSPVYYINQFVWKFDPHLNKTLLGLVYHPDKVVMNRWFFLVRGFLLPWFLFIFTTVCTVVLIATLKKNSEWRKRTTAEVKSGSNQTSSRDAKASSLVVIVSVVFIVCLFPSVLCVVAITFVPGISINGEYENLQFLIFSINFIFESVNASVNIFIYYFRNSNYRKTFNRCFRFFFKESTSRQGKIPEV